MKFKTILLSLLLFGALASVTAKQPPGKTELRVPKIAMFTVPAVIDVLPSFDASLQLVGLVWYSIHVDPIVTVPSDMVLLNYKNPHPENIDRWRFPACLKRWC